MVPFASEAKGLGFGVPKKLFALLTGGVHRCQKQCPAVQGSGFMVGSHQPSQAHPSWKGRVNKGPQGGSKEPMDHAKREEDGLPKGKA